MRVEAAVRLTATNGLERLVLQLQSVQPGAYIRRTDPEYIRQWQDLPMTRQGAEGNGSPATVLYTATVPAEWQVRRRLIRYRVRGLAGTDIVWQWPASTNCPNGAWFVYDAVPDWIGASAPGGNGKRFSSAFLSTLPIYHLIARRSDVERSQWEYRHNRERFRGTLVYGDEVYDHIEFHNRGQASTYVAGKNKWGFHFNREHRFAARDLWSRPYRFGWSGLDLNACASPWAQVNRGMSGMDEAVSYRAYQLAGVPSPDTCWIHFRVIDGAEEQPDDNQYGGDLWGLYLVVQQKDETWLRERGLPDGDIISAEGGLKHAVNERPDGVFESAFEVSAGRASARAWRSRLDLDAYHSFRALNRVLANIDLRYGGNYYLYHPADRPWVVLPHDLDMMFIPKTHQAGEMQAADCLSVPSLRMEYMNRAREILDLFCSDPAPAGGQVGQLVTELARFIAPDGYPCNWAELDEAMWNHHPRTQMSGQFNRTPYHDSRMGGSWVRTLDTPDFEGFCRYIINFCTDSRPSHSYRINDGNQRGYGFGYLRSESNDPRIPDRPTLRYSGAPDFPAGSIAFEASPFHSGHGTTCAAIEWRIAEISAPGLPGFVAGQPWRYEVEPGAIQAKQGEGHQDYKVPESTCRAGHTYRSRVRYRDAAGRCSHWSEPVQFTASAAAH